MADASQASDQSRCVLVIGDGSWGTALALVAARAGHYVRLWSHDAEASARLAADRENKSYLPGIELPENIEPVADPFQAAAGAELCLSVVPSRYLRTVASQFAEVLPAHLPVISASKGLEIETFKRPTQILAEVLGERPLGVLTGPSHAEEVALGKPASLLVACDDAPVAEFAQGLLNGPRFRVYTSTDAIGAELGGALKNVIALAAGICDGLELGDNAKSAMITRGIVELARFGRSHGARTETFFGLAGVGDLITTCCSPHSRNRSVGERIGRGASLTQVLEEMHMVAEGVWTTRALFGPESDVHRSEPMPIAEQVHAILFDGRPAGEALEQLMQRSPAVEMEGLFEV
ncbi:MAG: NAD(P)H-dependent glycerol-3-phosphate dehydrogenase [Planctomycetota bacterium]|jgi:glycerol-3-phosphate dehydrogenase (NAD(P)+)